MLGMECAMFMFARDLAPTLEELIMFFLCWCEYVFAVLSRPE